MSEITNEEVHWRIEGVRDQLENIRRELESLNKTHECATVGALSMAAEMQTASLMILYSANESLRDYSIKEDSKTLGPWYFFASRGIGQDYLPNCFCCGLELTNLCNNISGFVKTKEEGQAITDWFNGGVRLDFRENEQSWIQVKIGACDKCLPNLEFLRRKTSAFCVIREVDVKNAIALIKI